MSKLEFSFEDFLGYVPRHFAGIAADRANARLEEMLRERPNVFTGPGMKNGLWTVTPMPLETGVLDTHRALLVNVERIDGK